MKTLTISTPCDICLNRIGRRTIATCALALLLLALYMGTATAVDLEYFKDVTGPMLPALTKLSELTPGLKALVGFIAFSVAFIALAALRNFSPVLFYLGVAVFGSVGLVVGGAIMGAVL